MAKVCHSCGRRPAFGHSRSHSMVATKRRFNPNLQKVRISEARRPASASTSARAASRPARSPRPLSAAAASLWPIPSLVRFRGRRPGALAQLEARREEVNDLNVFPVADGDTGDNMALTLRAVLDELDRLSEQGDARRRIGRDEIVEGVARAALLGARGNSGVILSQLIRGAAEELVSRPGELVDPVLVGAAMARAADRAYASVREPAEGTILTVVREMAHRVAFELAHMDAAAPRATTQVEQPEPADRRGPRARARRRPGSRCGAAPSCCRSCARPASSTPAATA